MELEGKVAIVTGAGHGIGRAHALELAKHGASVVVNDLGTSVTGDGADQKAADLTVELIGQRGGAAVANYDDVSDYDGAGRLVTQAVDTYGRLDVLVNNAGIVRDTAIWNMSEADFDAVIKVHLKGSWAPAHHAARHWRERAKAGEVFTGRVINTTSGAGLVGNFGQTNYATAKAGIAGFTQTLSLELYKLGVTVNRGTRGGHPDHGHHARRAGGHRGRRGARGGVEPHGSGRLVSARRVARQRREPAHHRSGHQGRGRGHRLDAGLDGRRHHLQRRQALGCRAARPAARHRRLQDPRPRPPLLSDDCFCVR
jgi:NAD(P)-dependent dehydrogenase (short-subunit alcohol dehydrogenase family)